MKERKLRLRSAAVSAAAAVTTSLAVVLPPMTSVLGSEYKISYHNAHYGPLSCQKRQLFDSLDFGHKRRRGRKKYYRSCDKSKSYILDLWKTMSHCRGGGDEMDMYHLSDATNFEASDPSDEKFSANSDNENYISRSEAKHVHHFSTGVINAFDRRESMDSAFDVINASTNMRYNQNDPTSIGIEEHQISPGHQEQTVSQHRPRIVIEFDTQAVERGTRHGNNSIRHRIRSRMKSGNEWSKLPQRSPSLSISLDAFSTPSVAPDNRIPPRKGVPASDNIIGSIDTGHDTLLTQLLVPMTRTAILLLTQTASLLPPLLLSRRALNTTWTAIVDYFTGRIFRTTFTKLERAYLRYYEFPAATRATARLVSQIGILLGLSWIVRWLLIIVFMGNHGPMLLGVTGVDVDLVGTSSAVQEAAIGPGWKVGLPCHQRGKGMAWLCSIIWIGSVVGIGHACAMALSVWGGPLRLQAAAQHAESPKHVLRRIIHHPIKWVKDLEEWKHLSSLRMKRNRTGKDQSRREHVFNPDPLLFPATWLPLRWLQILALSKAFSTDPLNYRWCSLTDDKVVIPRLMKQYLVQLALGDEWRRVCLGEKRVGLGIAVVLSYFVALLWMVFTTFTLDGGAAAMLIPSVFAAIISGFMNIMIFWNRLGTREQKKALNAMGYA
eukprot:CAMPEP_0181078288 /NCGR_PEP_ID=MMETSP1071-20121207/1404_1 /TAXON_ID=35127 /ORGANISM="Thalassiosira sp., Strain NH16" /LENGTH=662 /DNA_ID=CAMNT_0023159589 /DNA_START=67 /DNA_END=2055 /DNA_ORIENTATION=+